MFIFWGTWSQEFNIWILQVTIQTTTHIDSYTPDKKSGVVHLFNWKPYHLVKSKSIQGLVSLTEHFDDSHLKGTIDQDFD